MNRGGDATMGILLAFVGLAILVAWKTGALAALLRVGPPSARSSSSVTQAITRTAAPDVASKLPMASIVPLTVSPQGPGGNGSTGNIDNGYSSTWIGSASYAAFRAEERTGGTTPRIPRIGDPGVDDLVYRVPVAIVSGGGGSGAMISPV